MKIKLKSVFVNSTNKDGQPYLDKNGNPFHIAVITSESDNKASMRIWPNQQHILQHVQTWRPGDEVDVEIEKSGDFYNFTVDVKPLDENRVRELIKEGIAAYHQEKKDVEEVKKMYSSPVNNEEPINVDDIHF